MTLAHPKHLAAASDVPSLSSLPPSATSPSSKPQSHANSENGVCTPLRKGATFHSSKSPSSSPSDPIIHIPSLPRRSHSCLSDIDAVTAGRRRMAAIISSIDRSLSQLDITGSSDAQDRSPLPDDLLTSVIPDTSESAGNPRPSLRQSRHSPISDSAIGSSIESDNEGDQSRSDRMTTINRAFLRSVSDHHRKSMHRLSLQAARHIERLIINPLLNQRSLKDFHPLVRDLPRRINEREILCLRDLEKTLIFLAPARSKSANSYLHFCESSLQCVHTTVDHLSEADRRRPTDVPYTNGYFLDLVGQIRQYASEVAASRARRVAGEAPTERDCSASETITLEGGLSQTGRAARLARKKFCGKFCRRTSLGDEQSLEETKADHPAVMKRALSGLSMEDTVHRSMARPRKLAPGEVVRGPIPRPCAEPGCDKAYVRECDMTKHTKVHSRPWKCTEHSCKYSKLGWANQKERDRHVNDRHSGSPVWFDCHYDCSYRSKRESNCKQHMEKTHGYKYDRIKGNGSKKADQSKAAAVRATPEMVQMPSPGSLAAGAYTPNMRSDSPLVDRLGWTCDPSVADPSSTIPAVSGFAGSEMNVDAEFGSDFDSNGLNPFSFNAAGLAGQSGTASSELMDEMPDLTPAEYANLSGYLSPFLPMSHLAQPQLSCHPSHLQWGFLDPNIALGHQEINWEQLVDLDAPPMAQLMTPNLSTEQHLSNSFSDPPERPAAQVGFLPSRQTDFNPSESLSVMRDEQFDQGLPALGRQTQDFTLYSSYESSSRSSGPDRGFFRMALVPENQESLDDSLELDDEY